MITALNWFSAFFGLLAALFWYWSAKAKVLAPPDTAGVGSLLGGYVISKIGDERIDLHATLEEQSTWNSRAAAMACLGALTTAASWTAQAYGW